MVAVLDFVFDEDEDEPDKFRYNVKLTDIDTNEVPDSLQEEVFLQLFRTAEIAQFSENEYQAYLDSLKVFRDNSNTFDYAVEKAREK